MINTFDIKQALRAWMADVGLQCRFKDEPRPMTRTTDDSTATNNPGVIAILNVIGSARNGVDQLDYDQDPTPGSKKALAHVAGIRHLTVSCRIESYTQREYADAMSWCETARSRLRLPRIISLLQAAGLAQIATTDAVDLPTKVDDHMISCASFDVRLGTLATDSDAPSQAGDTLHSVDVKSDKFFDLDGNPTDSQMDETIEGP